MALKIVAALTMNMVIGKDGQLPWKLPKDLNRFRDITGHSPVAMGRRTYWSLPDDFRPLPNRENIVLTKHGQLLGEAVTTSDNFNEVIRRAEKEDIFVIGGGEIYALALPYTDEMFLTRVQAIVPGDTFFPSWDWDTWKLESQEWVIQDERNRHNFAWEVWRRR